MRSRSPGGRAAAYRPRKWEGWRSAKRRSFRERTTWGGGEDPSPLFRSVPARQPVHHDGNGSGLLIGGAQVGEKSLAVARLQNAVLRESGAGNGRGEESARLSRPERR